MNLRKHLHNECLLKCSKQFLFDLYNEVQRIVKYSDEDNHYNIFFSCYNLSSKEIKSFIINDIIK